MFLHRFEMSSIRTFPWSIFSWLLSYFLLYELLFSIDLLESCFFLMLSTELFRTSFELFRLCWREFYLYLSSEYAYFFMVGKIFLSEEGLLWSEYLISLLGISPTFGELIILGISLEITGFSKLFRTERDLWLFCRFPSTDLGLFLSYLSLSSYFAPGNAIFRDFKSLGHNMVPIRLTFLLSFDSMS